MSSPASTFRFESVARRLVTWRYLVAAFVGIGVGLVQRASSPPDYLLFSDAGARIWSGDWGSVFGDRTIQAGPVQLALLAVFRPLRHLSPLLDVQALHVFGGVVMAVGLMWAGKRLRELHGLSPAPHLELVAVGLAVVWGWVGDDSALGHPAEIAIPGLWVASAVMLRQRRPVVAGMLLAAATGWETWALLGVGVVALAPSWRLAWRFVVALVLTGMALWLPFVLAGPFRMSRMRWEIAPHTPLAQLFGADTFSTTMRLAQLLIAVGVSVAVALATKRQSGAIWLVPTTAVVARLALDPLQYSYYWLAPMTLLLFALITLPKLRKLSSVVVLATLYCQVIAFGGAAKTTMIAASALLLAFYAYLSRAEGTANSQHLTTMTGETAVPRAASAGSVGSVPDRVTA